MISLKLETALAPSPPTPTPKTRCFPSIPHSSSGSLWDSSVYTWAFQSMGEQSNFNIVATLTVKLPKIQKANCFLCPESLWPLRVQRALSSINLLFITPFYLKLSTILLHSKILPGTLGINRNIMVSRQYMVPLGSEKKWILLQRSWLS